MLVLETLFLTNNSLIFSVVFFFTSSRLIYASHRCEEHYSKVTMLSSAWTSTIQINMATW